MSEIDRYARQSLVREIGAEGQQRLATARVVVAGCGALGSAAANLLARAGIGHLRVLDRDIVELHNLQRQVLYTEQDAHDGVPKALAAGRRLRAINSTITIEALAADLNHQNAEELLADADVIVDAVDNFETRYLVNDVAVKHGVPWVYGGVIATGGVTLTVLPGDGPCLRCLFPQEVAPGDLATCDTAGILGPIVQIIASFQVAEAMKLAMGRPETVRRELLEVDAWSGEAMLLRVNRNASCPVCAERRFEHLAGARSSATVQLCGRDAVQIRPASRQAIDLAGLAERLRPVGEVTAHEVMVRLTVEGYQLSIFADGRALIHGTADPALARSLYARYVGQ